MPRQIYTIFLRQNWFESLGCKTQGFQEWWQQTVPTGRKPYNARSRFQLVYATEESTGHCTGTHCWRRKIVFSLTSALSKDMEEQLKLAQKVIDVVDRANRKTCLTLPRYSMDKPESSYAQVRFFAMKKDDEKFWQIVYVIYKLWEFIYLLDTMKSV